MPSNSKHCTSKWAALLLAFFIGCGGPTVVPNAPVTLKDVPPEVLLAAQKKFPDVKITNAWQTPTGNFELSGQTKRGKLHELVVSASGEILESE